MFKDYCAGGKPSVTAVDRLANIPIGECPTCGKMLPTVGGFVDAHPVWLFPMHPKPGSIRQ